MVPAAGGPATSPGTLSEGYGAFLLTTLLVLAVVCVVAWLVVRVGSRWLGAARTRGGLLDVLARVPLEPRRSLYVVEVAGKTLLVGTSEMGLAVLSELDGDAVRAKLGARPSGGGFAEALRAVLARRGARRGAADGDAGGE